MIKHYPLDAISNSNDVVGNAKEVEASDRHRWVPSRLTRLDGSAFRAGVDDHRVAYEGANKGSPCDMTMAELQSVANFFPWPRGVTLRLPCSDGLSLARYPGCIVLHKEALRAGFRLPLHPFICDFLFDTEICPAQFTPNSWRCILTFLLKCKELNLVPLYEAFKFMYEMNTFYPSTNAYAIYGLFFRNLCLFRPPPHVNSWDKKWFLVCQSEGFHFNFPMYPGHCGRCKGVYNKERKNIDNQVHEFIKVLKSPPHWYLDSQNVLYGRALEDAGLSLPQPGTGQAGQVDMYELYMGKKRKVQAEGSWVESEHMEGPRKNAKTFPSQLKDLDSSKPQERPTVMHPVNAVPARSENIDAAQDGDDQDSTRPQERPSDAHAFSSAPDERVNINVTWTPDDEEVAEEQDEEVVNEVEEEELASTRPQEMPAEDTSINSARVEGGNEVNQEGVNVPSEGQRSHSSSHDSAGPGGIGALCREVSTALGRFPEIMLAAQHSEELERQLNESRQENVELKREKADLEQQLSASRRREVQLSEELAGKEREFQSRIELMKKAAEEELVETQSKLIKASQMAKELLELSSLSNFSG